jgi:hypothetical protein
MFEQYQKSRVSEWGPRILVFSVVGLLLSLGLCGIGLGAGQMKAAPIFLIGGWAVLGISLLGVVVGLVWIVVEAVLSRGK